MKIHTYYIERYKFLLLSVIFLFSAMLIETNFFSQHFKAQHAELFETIIHAKQQFSLDLCDKIEQISPRTFESYHSLFVSNKRLLTNQDIHFFVYSNDTLLYWSNNRICPSDSIFLDTSTHAVYFIDNGWYFSSSRSIDSLKICVFSHIKSEYPYQNAFIKNKFHSDFGINPHISILTQELDENYNVYLPDGSFLLGLSKNHGRSDNAMQRYFSIFLYLLGIIFLLIFLHHFVAKIKKRYIRDAINGILLFLFVLMRFWMIENQIPYVCYTTNLFQPEHYASSFFVPSLGDLFIHVLLFVYFIYQLQLRIRERQPHSKVTGFILTTVFLILSSALFALIINTYESVIYDSTLNLELYKLLDSSILSFVALAILGIMMLSYFLVLFAGYSTFQQKINIYTSTTIIGIILISSFVIWHIGMISNIWYVIAFQILAHGLFLIKIHKNRVLYTKGFRFLLLFFVALFSQLYINYHNQLKKQAIQKVIAINTINEQDPVAEILLQNVKEQMVQDTTLRAYLQNPLTKDDIINTYLQNTYFSGFLHRYNLESTVCGDAHFFESPNQLSNCESYFSSILSEYGVKLPNNDYFFLNNQNGSISYFDSITYKWRNGTITKLYIELNSKRLSQELGYPELLLQENISQDIFLDFSHAKYVSKKLVSQKGDYPYSLELHIPYNSQEFYTFSEYKHTHTVYQVNESTTIIVSSKNPSFFNHLVSFSYLFIFFFLILVLYDIGTTKSLKLLIEKRTFTDKIKFSLFSVVFASLLLTGLSLVVLNIHQYSLAQQKNVKEKMQSILVELRDDIENNKNFNTQTQLELYNNLLRYSNIYFTDINVYNKQGYLIASSRPEIFTYNLTGNQIKPEAFYMLSERKLPEFIHKESIGTLSYTSAYASITNAQNQVVAYLNLPYFTKQAELTQQISSLIVAILNIFVILLMLSTVLAVFLSNKITYPLQMLRDKMKLVKIGAGNEKISWQTSDEIGDLIQNYNAMIDQLESSAQKLAESEREGAWHEMAKQIAHEIKNPLTPIKLNIQLLHKAWHMKDPDFENRLNTISHSIIEQIETLSETANSFSNFAKISEGKPEEIELNSILYNTITLFGQEQHIEIRAHIPNEKIYVFADKEKIVRVCNNIIKNAIQSISHNQKGLITITLELMQNSNARITFADNGKGIPHEIRSKLFTPNFTTKTQGSGLGLAICKKIIEQVNGTIWFETELQKGSKFFIEIPSIKTQL